MTIHKTSLPRDILTMIGKFANIEITTKDYKKYNKLTRLQKVKNKCDHCKRSTNCLNRYYGLDVWSELETYKLDFFKDCDLYYFCNECKKFAIPTRRFMNVFNRDRFIMLCMIERNNNTFYFKNDIFKKVQYYRYLNKCYVVPCRDITNVLM